MIAANKRQAALSSHAPIAVARQVMRFTSVHDFGALRKSHPRFPRRSVFFPTKKREQLQKMELRAVSPAE